MKSLIILLLLLCADLSRAQDPMAKWKPNVGDKFTYDRVATWQHWGSDSGRSRDTVTVEIVQTDTVAMEIVQTDSSSDTIARPLVAVGGAAYRYFYFHVGHDTLSAHSVAINSFPFNYDRGDPYFDFSWSADSQVSIGSKQLTVYVSNTFQGYMWAATLERTALYSPDIRWFVYLYDHTNGTLAAHYTENDFTSETLISASTLGVTSLKESQVFTLWCRGGFLHLSLGQQYAVPQVLCILDPLGRPIRSWQLAASDGPREFTLNVSDVPSGVYFLRLQGSGVDEVKRVAIIH